ncbi:MAG TPA: diguanylate cyclase [Chloroflexota bacterium]|nr:diguanylate cyclase [Chloroflexota bacterium]
MWRDTGTERGHGALEAVGSSGGATREWTPGSGRAGRTTAPGVVWGLRARLIAVVVLAALLAGGLVSTLAVGASRAGLQAEIRGSTLAEAEAIAQLAYRYMDAAESALRDLAASPSLEAAVLAGAPEQAAPQLEAFLRRHPAFDNVVIYDAQGVGRVGGNPDWQRAGESNADRDWFQQVTATGEPYLGIPLLTRGTRQQIVTYAVPIRDAGGSVRGVLVGGVKLGDLAKAMFDIEAGIGTRTSLHDRREGGIIIAHVDPARILTPISGRNEAVRRELAGERGTLETANSTGQMTLSAFAPVPNLPWAVLIQYPTEVAFASVDGLVRHVLIALLLAVVLATAVGAALAVQITRPVRRLHDAAIQIAAGDLTRRVNVTGRDEIGALGRAFDQMAEALLLQTRQIQAGAQQLETLNQLGEWLQACTTVDEAHAVIARLVGELFPGMAGSVGVISASRNLVEVVATWGPVPAGEEGIFAPDECWALRRGQPHVVEDAHHDLVCPHLQRAAPAASVCIPLVAHGETTGLLHLARAAGRDAAPSTASMQRLATQVAEQLALALSNLALRERLRNQSIRDPLTGLFNRRYLEETLERELARAERSHHPMGVIMIDVDHFKQFNDSFGHNAGDALLREFGGLLRKHVRGSDIACRYGGEEFAVILPDATLEDTVRRAEELRAAMAHLQVADQDQALGQITISAGVAALPQHGADGPRLLRAADRALYAAKSAGRNRVQVADGSQAETQELPEAAGAGLGARLGHNGHRGEPGHPA